MTSRHNLCCFGTCNSDSRVGRPGYDPNLKFYRFPQPCLLWRDNILTWTNAEEAIHIKRCEKCQVVQRWMGRCKQSESRFQRVRQISPRLYICSQHFNDKPVEMDYDKYLPSNNHSLESNPSRRRLRMEARLATMSGQRDITEEEASNTMRRFDGEECVKEEEIFVKSEFGSCAGSHNSALEDNNDEDGACFDPLNPEPDIVKEEHDVEEKPAIKNELSSANEEEASNTMRRFDGEECVAEEEEIFVKSEFDSALVDPLCSSSSFDNEEEASNTMRRFDGEECVKEEEIFVKSEFGSCAGSHNSALEDNNDEDGACFDPLNPEPDIVKEEHDVEEKPAIKNELSSANEEEASNTMRRFDGEECVAEEEEIFVKSEFDSALVDPLCSSSSFDNAWFYATLSVVLISLCGLLAVAVIPVMQKQIYHGLLQFLVALAVGTLLGDALLHLLPHAMMSAHADHSHSTSHSHDGHDEDQHTTNLLKGLVAALSAIFFYFTEKGLSMVTDWKKRNQRKNKAMTKVRVMREDRSSHEEARVGEKLCKHKYSSYPYCYGEITNNTECTPAPGESEAKNNVPYKDTNNPKAQEAEGESQKEEVPNSEKQLLDSSEAQNEYTTIILREHETVHHGHSHTHGHVHSAPGSIKSVAWMVIMGDGIHNLTDGLAIGAAFAANIGGGLSTAVAVFCHELPHEIGDFAVLLKAGMSTKEAVVYNMISSILCLIGMSIGVLLGQNDNVKLWVFSAAAGMFLYIALVDMIPELTSSHASDGSSACCQCLLQLLGLLSGIGIMLVIAFYEHDLMTVFQNSL